MNNFNTSIGFMYWVATPPLRRSGTYFCFGLFFFFEICFDGVNSFLGLVGKLFMEFAYFFQLRMERGPTAIYCAVS